MIFKSLFCDMSSYASGVWLWEESGNHYWAPGHHDIEVNKDDGVLIGERLYKMTKGITSCSTCEKKIDYDPYYMDPNGNHPGVCFECSGLGEEL